MRLAKLHIHKAPGLEVGLPPLEIGPGLTLIVGPNASGKSTITHTLAAVLWPDEAMLDATADSHWQIDSTPHEARLFASAVHWSPALQAGAPRGAAGLARFGIKSLLDAKDPGDRDVAVELAQELAGGFDLAAAAAAFDTPPRYRTQTKEARAHKQALLELAGVKRLSDNLERREQELAKLDTEIEAAEQAKVAAETAERLGEVLAACATAEACERACDAFPDSLEALTGHEAEELADLEPALDASQRELDDAEVERDSHAARVAELEGVHPLPGAAELETWKTRAESLRELEREERELHVELEATTAALASARKRLHAPDETQTAHLDGAHLEGLGEAIRAWRSATAALAATQQAADLWNNWAEPATDEHSGGPHDLEGGLHALRRWLRSPRAFSAAVEAAAPARGLRRLAVAAMLLGVFGTLLALGIPNESFELPAALGFTLLALAGLGLLGLLRQVPSEAAPTATPPDEREAAQRAGEQAGLELGEWTTDAVERALAGVESRREGERSAAQLAVRAGTQRASLESELRRAREAETRCRNDLLDRVRAAGIGEPWLDLGAAAQVEALIALGRALDDKARASARLAKLETDRTALLDAAALWLAAAGRPAPADAAALGAERDTLANRLRELANENSILHQAALAQERLARQVQQQAAKRATLWQRTGLEPGQLAALGALMDELERWRHCNQERRDADGELAAARRRFAETGGSARLAGLLPEDHDPERLAPEALAKWATEQADRAKRLSQLLDERGRIRNSIEAASRGQQLADAIAAVRVSAEEIAAERTTAACDSMARSLIAGAARQQQTDHTPQLLQRAQEYFGRFTQQAWRIELGTDQSFVAIDVASGHERCLDELSDGTRIQLLLAARLSALESREDGRHVPICLDEALSTTDPRRFRAIAAALFELADDETAPRQVLYFTADMGEAEQWKLTARELDRPEPPVVDLGRLRGEPADWGGALAPRPAAPEPLPDPTGQTPDEYATTLGVARPDGFAEPATWHLFTLAFDDLPALTTCVRWQLPTIGTWRAARDADRLPPELDATAARRFSSRLELVDALARLWRLGRGRPITWSDIEASDAVSDKFGERVRTVLEAEHRHPRTFVEEIFKLQRFKKQASKLEAHLIDCGALPTEDPLEANELQRRTLAAAQPAATELGIDQAATYTRWLASLLSQ